MRPFLLGLAFLAVAAGSSADPPGDPVKEYEARVRKLGDGNAKGWLALADYCEGHLLWSQRAEALRKAVTRDPNNVQAHARLDEKPWGKEWLPADEAEAKEIEENQTKGLVFYGTKWINAKDAEKYRADDRKVVKWDLDFRMDTPRLVLYSAQPVAETWRLAAVLESAIEAYRRLYGALWKLEPKPSPFRVFFFADRETFEKTARASGAPSLAPAQSGFYHSGARILFVGVAGDGFDHPRRRMKTAVHEMSHALDDLLAHPEGAAFAEWVLEGRADYLGCSVAGRQVLPGAVHLFPNARLAEMLEKSLDSTSLPALFGLSPAEFQGKKTLENYAAAWGLVHFLFHGEGARHAEGFRKFMKGSPAHVSQADFEKQVGKIPEIQEAFVRYARDTLVPAARAARDEG